MQGNVWITKHNCRFAFGSGNSAQNEWSRTEVQFLNDSQTVKVFPSSGAQENDSLESQLQKKRAPYLLLLGFLLRLIGIATNHCRHAMRNSRAGKHSFDIY